MDRLLEQLIENLTEEKNIYSELLEISERKKQVIMNSRIKDLEKIVQVEQEFIIRIGSLENKRQEIIGEMAAQKKVKPEEITISTLVNWSSGEVKQRLENIKEALTGIIERQKELNRVNERLLKINLEYVDFAINFLTGNYGTGTFYEKKGQASKSKQTRNLFDEKV